MSVTDRSAPAPTTTELEDAAAPRGASRTPRPAVLATLALAVVLVVGTIGPPLAGRGVFLTADTIYDAYPWRALESPGSLGVQEHGPTSDTVDGIYPTRAIFSEAARSGDFLGWDPLAAGGAPVGSESSDGVLSPFAWLFILLPAWYAPAAVKLAVMAAAIGFTYLFCRRVGTGRVPALFAGLAYAGSGFLVMWTNWQHPEVAALIPALFWATERYLQRPAARSVVPIALVMAAMLLGEFPAVVGYALCMLVGYVAIRLFAHRGTPARRRVAVAGGGAAGILAGVLLVAAILLPFAAHLGDLDLSTREQTPDRNLGLASLVTTVAPTALGLSTEGPDARYFGPENQVEVISFVGVTTALAAVVALCLAAPRAMPRGTRVGLAAAVLGLGVATYAGGLPLRLLQQLPVFSDNYIGRTRSILGFAVAVLAALGLQSLSERRSPNGRRGWLMAAAIAFATVAVAALAGDRALELARAAGRTAALRSGLVLPVIVGMAALAALALVRFGRASLRTAALVSVVALLVVESLRLSVPLLPNEDRAHLYPSTPGIEFLQRHQDAERTAPEGFTLFGTAPTFYGLRTVTGHSFFAATWKQALLAADAHAFAHSPGYATLRADEDVMASPVLDRLGVRWFAASGATPPPGRREDHGWAVARCERPVTVSSSSPSTVTVTAGDGLRGLIVQPCATTALPTGAALRVEARGAGRSASGQLRLTGVIPPTQAMSLAVPAQALAGAGRIRVSLALDGAPGGKVPLASAPDGSLAYQVIRPTDDGLRLAFADDLRIYERTRALPRIRWASRATVIGDPDRRLSVLASGAVPADTVVLDQPDRESGARTGAEAELAVESDDSAGLEIVVDAGAPGHLVIADALQHDWVATVDGERADLVAADHAGVAVRVLGGHHKVELRYRPRGQRVGLVLSALATVALVAAAVAGHRARRRPA
jgi:hypothetical protein